jgi:hypothetical protein
MSFLEFVLRTIKDNKVGFIVVLVIYILYIACLYINYRLLIKDLFKE